MHLQTIVALTDFSAAAEQGLDRAALLASSHHARLRILYGAETIDPRFVDPQARLEQRARQLARRHDIVVTAVESSGDGVGDLLAEAGRADLLVVYGRMRLSWRKLWRGSGLSRILRSSPCPVLVVQSAPRGAYERVLVAANFSKVSGALLRYAGGLEADAWLEVYHAIDSRDEAKLRSAEASMKAVQRYRTEAPQHARHRMLQLTDAFDTRRNRVATVIGAGDPARQLAVQQESSGADLVAVGHTRRPAWVEFLVGGVAQRLVGGIGCDLLVFPRDYALPEGRAGAPGRGMSGQCA